MGGRISNQNFKKEASGNEFYDKTNFHNFCWAVLVLWLTDKFTSSNICHQVT